MRLVNKRNIPNLDAYIESAKMDLVKDNFSTSSNAIKKFIKRLVVFVGPTVLLLIAWLVTGLTNAALVIGALVYLWGSATVCSIKDGIKNEKTMKKMDEAGITEAFNLKYDNSSITQKRVSDYYRQEFKEFMESNTADDEKKYIEIVSKQTEINQDSNEILTQEETISQITHEIDVYYDAYKLPKSVMQNEEWDTLFDNIFELMKEKEITNLYYQTVSEFIRIVLGRVLVSDQITLSLKNFTENIECIRDIIAYTTPVNITEEELADLKINIERGIIVHKVENVKNSKIIDFNQHKRKRGH